jgi:acylphosphatase
VSRVRVARRAVVHGHVQGVFFRDSCRRRAEALGVAGWARNLPDGTVEVFAEADSAEAVDALIDWCRTGPRGASVTRVDVEEATPEGLDSFSVR